MNENMLMKITHVNLAPEIALQAEFYDAKCDVRSFGFVLHRIFYNSFSIWSTSPEEHVEKLKYYIQVCFFFHMIYLGAIRLSSCCKRLVVVFRVLSL